MDGSPSLPSHVILTALGLSLAFTEMYIRGTMSDIFVFFLANSKAQPNIATHLLLREPGGSRVNTGLPARTAK